jgi:hypothetical protein
MAQVIPVQPVQLLVGVIFADPEVLELLTVDLRKAFGAIEMTSPVYEFDITGYYADEMGGGLKRIFFSFVDLISPESLVRVKTDATSIEDAHARDGHRRVNIDPGYMDFYKLVLASYKYLGQKIYLGKGVYADPTLYYDKGWKPYDWGFPDFKSGKYDRFLTEVRTSYKGKIRNLGGSPG